MFGLASVWLLLACGPGGGVVTGLADVDGDGNDAPADCDDLDARRSPGLPEVCDRLDNDCDGLVDAGDPDLIDGATWFADTDEDGVGDGGDARLACTRPDGYVGAAGDCDDADSTVSTSTTWYTDADADGYGDPLDSLAACRAEGHVTDATDCDDTAPDVFPGADEVCGDGRDGDCDGTPNGPGDSAEYGCGPGGDQALPGFAAAADAEGEQEALGFSVAGLGTGLFAVGAPRTNALAGSVTVFGWAGGALERVAELAGDADNAQAGWGVAPAGDTDADGSADLLVVAGPSSASVWLVRGPFTADRLLSDADATVEPVAEGMAASVAAVGDQDGDALPDFLIGISDAAGANPAIAYVVSGAVDGTVDLLDTIGRISSRRGFDGATAAGLGDLDGDGLSDAALVDAAGTVTLTSQGIVYLLAGPLTGELSTDAGGARIVGEEAYGGLGMTVAGPGDIDGDGYADVWVGRPAGSAGTGAVFLIRGPVRGTISLAAAAFTLRGEGSGEAVGRRLAAADVNGDGALDLLAGGAADPTTTGSERGEILVCFGPLAGARVSSEADGRYFGAEDGAKVGYALAGAGDLDGDGDDEGLAGAPGTNGTGEDGVDEAGRVYVLLGGPGL